MFRKFSRKWGTCRNTRFPLTILICAGYNMKVKNNSLCRISLNYSMKTAKTKVYWSNKKYPVKTAIILITLIATKYCSVEFQIAFQMCFFKKIICFYLHHLQGIRIFLIPSQLSFNWFYFYFLNRSKVWRRPGKTGCLTFSYMPSGRPSFCVSPPVCVCVFSVILSSLISQNGQRTTVLYFSCLINRLK